MLCVSHVPLYHRHGVIYHTRSVIHRNLSISISYTAQRRSRGGLTVRCPTPSCISYFSCSEATATSASSALSYSTSADAQPLTGLAPSAVRLRPTHTVRDLELRVFDPSRLISFEGEIPSDRGKPSNFLIRGILLHGCSLRESIGRVFARLASGK